MDEQMQEGEYYVSDVNTRVRDIEEKVRLLKDRVVLIGQNLIESRENSDNLMSEMKVSIEGMRKEIEKIKEKIQIILEELDSYSRRDEVALMRKQFKMFEPLQFARIEDVERIVDEKIKEMMQNNKEKNSLEKDKRGYIF